MEIPQSVNQRRSKTPELLIQGIMGRGMPCPDPLAMPSTLQACQVEPSELPGEVSEEAVPTVLLKSLKP